MTNLDSIFKSRDITLPTKVCLVKAMVFPVWMWELDCEEGWALKNWCFWMVVLEKTLESSQSYGFSCSHAWMWELDRKEGQVLKNWCFWMVVLEKTLERFPWTARRSNQSILNEISPEYSLKGLVSWSWSSNILTIWCKEPTHWKRPWCWERLRARGEGDNRGWDSWMASLIQWTWVWAGSGREWRMGKPGVLQSTRSQRIGHDWATEQQQIIF